jgi:hypothetical protein
MMEPTKRPDCFGDLNTVFPRRADGLRVSPIACLQCVHKTPCLRSAMADKQGLTVREEMIERAERGGLIGFFQRWSQKKSIQALKEKK